MTPILEQFLSESRDFLQGIGEKLIQLETSPDDGALMSELFRLVHTLKGNCGLFDFPELARVLHAAEDLMVVVRDGSLAYSQHLADQLLESMDFVGLLLDEIETSGSSNASHAGTSAKLASALRQLIASVAPAATAAAAIVDVPDMAVIDDRAASAMLALVPPAQRLDWLRRAGSDSPVLWVRYTPETECFFKGEDPFFQARQTPHLAWQGVSARETWPALAELDAYRCVLDFQLVSTASRAALEEHFRYVPDQVAMLALTPHLLAQSLGMSDAGPASHQADAGAIASRVIDAQLAVLGAPDQVSWLPGRLKGVAATLAACFRSLGEDALLPALDKALASAQRKASAAPLLDWLQKQPLAQVHREVEPRAPEGASSAAASSAAVTDADPAVRFGRRAEDSPTAPKTLKVEQVKVDRLMDLIGEMVVAKNGLPYLADRAESVFGSRELSREIKNQYAVINRIAEEMQDAIMQVRMMPVSFVFQRFPRLVRDISRRLGKEVELVLEGEETEADKNIIEALADPLIHIVRNSLDHGIELPEVRRAAGKPREGRLVIRASHESDRVVIDIHDDGRGIDPIAVKRKAFEKGLIDEVTRERMADQDAINLIFAAGFSTVDVVSDLSGRGVGMDVVRSAVEKVNGTVTLESRVGEGTRLRLSLPLSMAVTNVMIVESDRQIFGVPMDMVVETVRVPRASIHTIKNHETAVLRGRVVPLRSLNGLLATSKPQLANDDGELATLVIRVHGEHLGIVVDDFREVVDIILKPMGGILGSLPGYAGSALLGDGSVLMVLNPKELVP